MVSDLFDTVKKELKDKELIRTRPRGNGSDYFIKMPIRFKDDKDSRSSVCFYRDMCKEKSTSARRLLNWMN